MTRLELTLIKLWYHRGRILEDVMGVIVILVWFALLCLIWIGRGY